MLLIADGGSTKCDWILLDSNGEQKLKTRTKGLNPAVFKTDLLENRIMENEDLAKVKDKITHVGFYGAGCGTKLPSENLKQILSNYFPNAEVNVREDMVAASYAVTNEPGIVCILGTGSNSCFFDGKQTRMVVDSLGYILMDEASGNYFGKRLIRDYYYQRMPIKLAQEFEERFNLDADEIKRNLYKEDNPNTYLAHFAEFIFTSDEVNGYFYKLISEGMKKFIENRVLCFKESQNVPIHFVGSIAHFSKEIIEDAMKPYSLELGNVIRRPIDGLIEHYRKNVL
ncbi:BadF-type ATPase [Mesonia phycicola]|uniref:BadF-type ATPase n=1 Tax=Mesonia phycicola TaxID=579105 RepID=A0A1M6DUJ4_9FLAO|nr:N-acetylglucosamine kinase [Mesonia phycicola]SHI76800.1 BadF-type ATPase [Mesonia phycicola]